MKSLKKRKYNDQSLKFFVTFFVLGFIILASLVLLFTYEEKEKISLSPLTEDPSVLLYYNFQGGIQDTSFAAVKDNSFAAVNNPVVHGNLKYRSFEKGNRALYFDGIGDYISLGELASIKSDDITVSLWAKSDLVSTYGSTTTQPYGSAIIGAAVQPYGETTTQPYGSIVDPQLPGGLIHLGPNNGLQMKREANNLNMIFFDSGYVVKDIFSDKKWHHYSFTYTPLADSDVPSTGDTTTPPSSGGGTPDYGCGGPYPCEDATTTPNSDATASPDGGAITGVAIQNTPSNTGAPVQSPRGEVAFYVDGVKVYTKVIGAKSLTQDPLQLNIGRYVNSYFTGFIDEVVIFNRALPEAEVSNIFGSSRDLFFLSTTPPDTTPPDNNPPPQPQTNNQGGGGGSSDDSSGDGDGGVISNACGDRFVGNEQCGERGLSCSNGLVCINCRCLTPLQDEVQEPEIDEEVTQQDDQEIKESSNKVFYIGLLLVIIAAIAVIAYLIFNRREKSFKGSYISQRVSSLK